ncbi:lipoprotein [Bacillus sp. JCM 19045]|nr:lipoprotein [Bacillus sp. JCM 19045]
MISHLKEPSLSFMNVEDYTIEHTEPLPSSWETQVSISDERVAALTNNANEIVLLHLTDGAVESFIELDDQVSTMVYDANEGLLIVASEQSRTVSFIAIDTGEIEQTISLDVAPAELHLDQAGNLFVLSTDAGQVDYIEMQLKRKKSFSVIDRPAGMFYDGHLLWVGGHGPSGELNDQLHGYDVSNGELVQSVDVGLMPIAITGSKDQSQMFVLCHGNDHLYQIDLESKEIVASIEVGHNPNFMYEYKEQLIVSNFDSDSLSIIMKEPFALMAEVEVEPGPYAISSGEIMQ